MFFEMSRYAEEVYYISKDKVPNFYQNNYKNLKLIDFSYEKNGLIFTIAACKFVYKICSRLPKDKIIIIHDIFISRVGLVNKFLFKIKRRKIYTVVSLYASNPELFIKKGWRSKNKYNFIYNFKNDFLYTTMLLKRILIESISCKFSDICIGNSKSVTDGIRDFYKINNKKIKMIPTCVDTNFFDKIIINPEAIGCDNNTRIILFVGRLLLWRKGLNTLFKAFKDLVEKENGYKLFLIGYQEPNDKKYLRKNIIDNNISNFVTIKEPMEREELKKYYCNADLFVFPSINEGSPRVLKEALSCGTPALVSDLPGNRIVDDNSNILSFFQPNNNKELGNKIVELLSNKKKLENLGNLSRKHMVENFTPKIISKKLYNHYIDMIN
jgi:glycosyltransferase involved in cell wall biosynthesis